MSKCIILLAATKEFQGLALHRTIPLTHAEEVPGRPIFLKEWVHGDLGEQVMTFTKDQALVLVSTSPTTIQFKELS